MVTLEPTLVGTRVFTGGTRGIIERAKPAREIENDA